MTTLVDFGGNTLITENIRVGATSPGQSGTDISGSELTVLDGVTAGTVTASKAVVVDASKDISAFRNVTATNYDAGASGTAGTVDIFPTTASKGKIQIAAADSAGDTTTTITNASQAAARTYTIVDAGTNANFVMSEGAATVNGLKTFADSVKIKQAVTQVNDTTPTAAELTTAFGNPATLGRGFLGTVDDNDGDTNGYIVWCSDASFYFLKGTKAT